MEKLTLVAPGNNITPIKCKACHGQVRQACLGTRALLGLLMFRTGPTKVDTVRWQIHFLVSQIATTESPPPVARYPVAFTSQQVSTLEVSHSVYLLRLC